MNIGSPRDLSRERETALWEQRYRNSHKGGSDGLSNLKTTPKDTVFPLKTVSGHDLGRAGPDFQSGHITKQKRRTSCLPKASAQLPVSERSALTKRATLSRK